jgi:hypothetical protein
MATKMVVAAAITAGIVVVIGEVHYLYRYHVHKDDPEIKSLWSMQLLPPRRHIPMYPTIDFNPRITVISAYTPNIASYADMSAKINKEYCDLHGYTFRKVVGPPVDPGGRHITWDKIHWMLDTLEDCTNPPEYVFWIDSDAIFNRCELKLERIIPKDRVDDEIDICICVNTYLSKNTNTGTILVKNTEWARKFLKHWWDLGANSRWAKEKYHEQSALDLIMSRGDMSCNYKIALFWPDEFNTGWERISWPLNKTVTLDSNFIIHYMGTPAEFRVQKFAEKLKSLS